MSRRRALLAVSAAGVGLLGLAAIALGGVAIVAVAMTVAGAEPVSFGELLGRIGEAATAARQAEALANSPWTGRLAGTGLGLAVGLLAGGVGAFVYYRRKL